VSQAYGTFVLDGLVYQYPLAEPLENRDLTLLHPAFRLALEAYLAYANSVFSLEVRSGEGRRTVERQAYLYAQSRFEPFQGARRKSNTMDSRHRYGVANDLILIDQYGAAVWDDAVWESLHDLVPSRWFGLKDIRPFELRHVELVEADDLIARGGAAGVVLT
jgi:hypothetical protein